MSVGPLRQVLEAVESGCASAIDVQRRTGLSADVVGLALEQLVRLGKLQPGAAGACPPQGCGGCPSAANACGSGPVLIGLSRR